MDTEVSILKKKKPLVATVGDGPLGPDLPSELFKQQEPLEGDTWPDGKRRPHKVKTRTGEVVALTDEEFDHFILQARHRYYAGQGDRKAPRSGLAAGDTVMLNNIRLATDALKNPP